MRGVAFPREHRVAALGVALVHAALGYFLLSRSLLMVAPPAKALIAFDVESIPEPAPPPPESAKARAPKPEGAASPANRRARPKPVVAPPPVVKLPPPIVAAPIAGTGPDASAGAAEIEGPGTGAGGTGTGTGSGGEGSGPGGGGGSGARWVRGRIRDSDYPRSASRANVGGAVTVHFDVDTKGRPRNCRVVASSGHPDLDATTCRLIEKRFRYKPAVNAAGEPVPDVAAWRQNWWLEPRDPLSDDKAPASPME